MFLPVLQDVPVQTLAREKYLQTSNARCASIETWDFQILIKFITTVCKVSEEWRLELPQTRFCTGVKRRRIEGSWFS